METNRDCPRGRPGSLGPVVRLLTGLRNRPAARAGAVVLLLAALAGAGMWYTARERAEAGRERAARQQAEANVQKAHRLVRDLLTEVGRSDLAAAPPADPARRALLVKALEFYQDVMGQEGDDPEARLEVGQAVADAGGIYEVLGDLSRARDHYAQAARALGELVDEFPTVPGYRHELALADLRLGRLLDDVGRHENAEKVLRQACDLLDRLSAEAPVEPAYRFDWARGNLSLGLSLASTGRVPEAEAAARQALGLLDGLNAEHPDMREYREKRADCLVDLGGLLRGRNRPGEAEKAYRDALGLYRGLIDRAGAFRSYRQKLGVTWHQLGTLLEQRARPAEADAAFAAALAVRKQLAADFPGVPAYRLDLAASYESVGTVLPAAGRSEQRARQDDDAIREAFRLKKALAEEFPRVADFRSGLGQSFQVLAERLREEERWAEARRSLELALTHQRKALEMNPGSPRYRGLERKALWLLADTQLRLGDHAAAAATAVALARLDGAGAEDACDAACLLARCMPVAEKDAALPAARRQEMAQAYADQAVGLLREAVRRGYHDADRLREDEDLARLRPREDFQQVLRQAREPAEHKGR
jgi:tetratricopeptide (TPR) repeat protein